MKTIHYPTFVGGKPLVTENHEVVSTNWKYNHPTVDKIQVRYLMRYFFRYLLPIAPLN